MGKTSEIIERFNKRKIMKIYKTVPVPAKTREVIVSKVCDICKKTYSVKNVDSWSDNEYEILETEIKLEKGEQYGPWDGGGDKTITEVDICPSCFENHLIPWLESMGAVIKKTEVDW